MNSQHRPFSFRDRLLHVARFAFALAIGAVFGLAAWESPAKEAQATEDGAFWGESNEQDWRAAATRYTRQRTRRESTHDGLTTGPADANIRRSTRIDTLIEQPIVSDDAIEPAKGSHMLAAQDDDSSDRTVPAHSRGPPD